MDPYKEVVHDLVAPYAASVPAYAALVRSYTTPVPAYDESVHATSYHSMIAFVSTSGRVQRARRLIAGCTML
eukprot:114608-Rhodomonas_salina.1